MLVHRHHGVVVAAAAAAAVGAAAADVWLQTRGGFCCSGFQRFVFFAESVQFTSVFAAGAGQDSGRIIIPVPVSSGVDC